MRAVKLESVVPKNRQLSLTVPPEIPTGPVEVLILAKDADAQQVSLIGFLDALELELSARNPEAIELPPSATLGMNYLGNCVVIPKSTRMLTV